MFRAAHRSSSGAVNCICSLCFICPYGDWLLPRLSGTAHGAVPTQPWQRPVTIWAYKPEAANTVYSSWWWAVCRSKHVEPLKNLGMINSIKNLHLVGISTEWVRSFIVYFWLSWLWTRHWACLLWKYMEYEFFILTQFMLMTGML